ncbi:UNVERIFIED_CONTAM: protein CONTINUOUS VASCULAR RING 1 [Sesamum radiatum]|uniref:Protein CONTINUOUS VASCULAR RING 1 n=1 Tax=Sesamum radiatum TaxID=300843 RepID=A0AAW2KNH4_SESRA
MGNSSRERDRELLIPVGDSVDHRRDDDGTPLPRPSPPHRFPPPTIIPAASVILFPIAITFYITWWFIHFVDGFFSPIYAQLGIDIFDQNTQAFKEVAIIRHPRIGEYAFGFITSSLSLQSYSGEEELFCVYVPTNHLYIGDIFLVGAKDVIRPNLSVREGIGGSGVNWGQQLKVIAIELTGQAFRVRGLHARKVGYLDANTYACTRCVVEIVVSGGMSMPQILSTLDPRTIQVDRIRPDRS